MFRHSRTLFALVVSIVVSITPATAGIWGAHDPVPASTLVVPFFEVGINQTTHPQNTNFTVYAARGPVTIHWEVWDRDGNGTLSLFGNVDLDVGETFSGNMNSLIGAALEDDRLLLADGDFYRGFMTIDVVTESTTMTPFNDGYPFGTSNSIIGTIYYLRLTEGSANGLPMIGLEYTSDSANDFLEGFYVAGDGREEIDDNARECAAALIQGNGPCTDSDQVIDSIRARVFHSAPLNGSTRVIVFTWTTNDNAGGGPSALCDGVVCDQLYSFAQRREDASVVQSGLLALDHVVNIIETVGPSPGEFLLFDVPDPNFSMQVYAFVFNSASPADNPETNWDAIFEASVWPMADEL